MKSFQSANWSSSKNERLTWPLIICYTYIQQKCPRPSNFQTNETLDVTTSGARQTFPSRKKRPEVNVLQNGPQVWIWFEIGDENPLVATVRCLIPNVKSPATLLDILYLFSFFFLKFERADTSRTSCAYKKWLVFEHAWCVQLYCRQYSRVGIPGVRQGKVIKLWICINGYTFTNAIDAIVYCSKYTTST